MSSIIRVEKNKNYTTMSNFHLKEKEMSLKAIGLLSKILSLPDNWDYSIAGLVSICKENETAIKSALDELKTFGYLKVIKKMPNETQTGRIEYEYIIYEEPQKQYTEKQDIDFLYVENQRQLNTNKLNTKNNTNIINNICINNVENSNESKKKEINNNIEKNKEEKILNENIKCIIDYLNESIGSKYKYNNKTTIKLIKARFKDGYKLDDFYDVIDKKVKDWFNTEMQKYLRPETLFGNKFENYLNQKAFTGKPKSSYSSKPTFDNTSNHDIPKGIASMTEEEKEDFIENELAKDENGNFLKF